jgi:hypothetical protein
VEPQVSERVDETKARGIDAGVVFLKTIALYALGLGFLIAGLKFFGAGLNKLQAFALFVIPTALIVIGCAQSWRAIFLGAFAGLYVWLSRWHFISNFQADEHVGPLYKELPGHLLSAGITAFVCCGLAAGLWQAIRRLRATDSEGEVSCIRARLGAATGLVFVLFLASLGVADNHRTNLGYLSWKWGWTEFDQEVSLRFLNADLRFRQSLYGKTKAELQELFPDLRPRTESNQYQRYYLPQLAGLDFFWIGESAWGVEFRGGKLKEFHLLKG